MAYTKYSLTPANNTAAPPDGAPEGMLPSAVNDTMRDMMAQIRDVGDGVRDGTYTMTAPKITGGTITGVTLTGNTLTNPVITGATLTTSAFNGTVGATTASTGAFTTLTSNGATTFTAGTASTSTTTGTTVITGGLGVSGRINAANFDGIVGANTAAAGSFSTLSATGVATFSAGTVSLPAITTTGDTNTGIFFPAADTIAFTEGGAESMRITSTGNVDIGSTASGQPINGKLTIYNAGSSLGALNSIVIGNNDGGAAGSQAIWMGAFGNGSYGAKVKVNYDYSSSLSTSLSFETSNAGTVAEKMRITGDGLVGIGTSSPSQKLNIATTSGSCYARVDRASQSTGQVGYQWGGGTSSTDWLLYMPTSSDDLSFFGNSAERMRITSTGNVGIGTSSPSFLLDVEKSSDGIVGYFRRVGATVNPALYITANETGNTVGFGTDYAGATSPAMTFTTGGTERMRIDSSGRLLVGTTSTTCGGNTISANGVNIVVSANYAVGITTPVGDQYAMLFANGTNGIVGSIYLTSVATAYNVTSDQRLKTNIVDAPSGNIDSIKVRSFDWIANGSHQEYGMVAQELIEVAPYAVTKTENPDDMMQVDYSKLVPMMIREIQDLKAEVNQLKAKIGV